MFKFIDICGDKLTYKWHIIELKNNHQWSCTNDQESYGLSIDDNDDQSQRKSVQLHDKFKNSLALFVWDTCNIIVNIWIYQYTFIYIIY